MPNLGGDCDENAHVMGDGGNLRGAGTVTVRMRQMRRWRKVIVMS